MINTCRQRAEEYRKAVFKPDGSITINHDQTQNKVFRSADLPSFTSIDLQELGLILLQMSFNPSLNAIIENDHVEYWSFVNTLAHRNNRIDNWIRVHHPLISFVDCNLLNQMQLKYTDQENRACQNALLSELRYRKHFASVWAGFAYLEGLSRRICMSYLHSDGTVTKAFKVAKKQYRSHRGNARSKSRKGSSQISNLYHLLTLVRRIVSKETRNVLSQVFSLHTPKEVFQWRNDCLHGSEDGTSVVIVLYSLISILLLEVLRQSEP